MGRVEGLEISSREQTSTFRDEGSGFKIQDSGFRVQGTPVPAMTGACRPQTESWFMVQGLVIQIVGFMEHCSSRGTH